MRRGYLKMMEVADAWRTLAERVKVTAATEEIDVADAAGRVNARPVVAKTSSPMYHGAAMDGFAVHAAETLGASEAHPLRLHRPDAARPIDTGDLLDPGFD